jgi:hypothetical protein
VNTLVLSVKTHRRVAISNMRSGRLPGLLVGPVPRSTVQDPAHDLASGLLGVPPDLVPDQEGVEVISISYLHAQTRSNISPSRDQLIG